jgi:hypothetical protein
MGNYLPSLSPTLEVLNHVHVFHPTNSDLVVGSSGVGVPLVIFLEYNGGVALEDDETRNLDFNESLISLNRVGLVPLPLLQSGAI